MKINLWHCASRIIIFLGVLVSSTLLSDDFEWEKTMIDTSTLPDSFWANPFTQMEETVKKQNPGLKSFSVQFEDGLEPFNRKFQVSGVSSLGQWCDLLAELAHLYCIHSPQGPHFFLQRHFCWETGHAVLKGKITMESHGTGNSMEQLFCINPNGKNIKIENFVVDSHGNYLALIPINGRIVTFHDGKYSHRIKTEFPPSPMLFYVVANGKTSQTNQLSEVKWNQWYSMDFSILYNCSSTEKMKRSDPFDSDSNEDPFATEIK